MMTKKEKQRNWCPHSVRIRTTLPTSKELEEAQEASKQAEREFWDRELRKAQDTALQTVSEMTNVAN